MNNTGADGMDTGDVPDAFVAVIVKVYIVPSVRPVNKIGLDVPVAIMLFGLDVIVYVSAYKEGVNVMEAVPEDGAATRFFGTSLSFVELCFSDICYNLFNSKIRQ